MAFGINEPVGNQPCDNGKVCVKGHGAIQNGQVAEKVCVKIYSSGGPSNPEAGPPSGSVCVTPDSNGDWCVEMVADASCSPTSPYPENEVWAWAEFGGSSSSSSSSSGSSSQMKSQEFKGKLQDDVPDCC